IIYPNQVWLNRGNHEDRQQNLRTSKIGSDNFKHVQDATLVMLCTAVMMAKQLENEMVNAGVAVLVVDPNTDDNESAAIYNRLRQSIPSNGSSIGLDCEGTDGHKGHLGPLMVQVASPTVAVVEVPMAPGKYSRQLRELLADEGIQKIVCQGKDDILSLGRCLPSMEVLGPVVDLQDITRLPATPTPGLAAILSEGDPQRVAWSKQSIKKKGWWRLETSEDMLEEPGFVSYAAADAWGTLLAYEQLTGQAPSKTSPLWNVIGSCLFAIWRVLEAAEALKRQQKTPFQIGMEALGVDQGRRIFDSFQGLFEWCPGVKLSDVLLLMLESVWGLG
ncbi:PPEF2, partial [Symbiodinium sp. CCMP2456]